VNCFSIRYSAIISNYKADNDTLRLHRELSQLKEDLTNTIIRVREIQGDTTALIDLFETIGDTNENNISK
jgi:hypothetical protein